MFSFIDVTPVDIFSSLKPDTSKWQRCFFDLEGSLTASEGNILQLACIVTDWDFNITGVHNEFFLNDTPISSQETKIHGLTEESLRTLATAHFKDRISSQPLATDKQTMFISYTTFDIKRVNAELDKYSMNRINFGNEVETLTHPLTDGINCHYNAFKLGKKKGDKVAEELGEDVFKEIYAEIHKFKNYEMKSNHDALYDTVMILALCRRLSNERDNANHNGETKS